jgi:hypothetical protein
VDDENAAVQVLRVGRQPDVRVGWPEIDPQGVELSSTKVNNQPVITQQQYINVASQIGSGQELEWNTSTLRSILSRNPLVWVGWSSQFGIRELDVRLTPSANNSQINRLGFRASSPRRICKEHVRRQWIADGLHSSFFDDDQ